MAAGTDLVLIADADPEGAAQLTRLLKETGHATLVCSTGAETLQRLEVEPALVVLSELVLPDMRGVDLLAKVQQRWPDLPVVMVAAGASVPQAVAALRAGAADFVQKPYDTEELRYVMGKALTGVKKRVEQPPAPSSEERSAILGSSAAMKLVHATLQRAAQSTATVLVRGESGTGKELAARAIHDASPLANAPFVKIDCTSLPEHLLESELFGYEKGAFTGAAARKPGRAELAHGGTLFLDEIGELGVSLQAKLLRLLQDKELEHLGGTTTIKVDVRVVAATHRDLESMIEREEFRLDLFYRLNVIPLWLPPLRARREDIDVLARHFCAVSAAANGKGNVVLDAGAQKLLRGMRWPGNVRQLQNFVERLVVLSPGPVIGVADIQAELGAPERFATQQSTGAQNGTELTPALTEYAGGGGTVLPSASPPQPQPGVLPLEHEMQVAEKRALERALGQAKHNRSAAARLLGVSRSTLYVKLKEHGLL